MQPSEPQAKDTGCNRPGSLAEPSGGTATTGTRLSWWTKRVGGSVEASSNDWSTDIRYASKQKEDLSSSSQISSSLRATSPPICGGPVSASGPWQDASPNLSDGSIGLDLEASQTMLPNKRTEPASEEDWRMERRQPWNGYQIPLRDMTEDLTASSEGSMSSGSQSDDGTQSDCDGSIDSLFEAWLDSKIADWGRPQYSQ